MSQFSTFLINLDDSTDRLAAADAQLQAAGLPYQRISAFDGRGRDPRSIPEYDEGRTVRFYGRPLTGGEIGCFLSHLSAAQRFLDSGADFGLVLEDDMSLTPETARRLRSLLENLGAGAAPDWELVNLGKRAKTICTTVANIDGHDLQRAFYFPVTTTALLWTREGARAFLREGGHIWAPVDHFLRHMMCRRGTGLSCAPALIVPTGTDSVIDAEGGQQPARRKTAKGGAWFAKEFRRQGANYLNAAKHAYLRRHPS